MNRALALLLFFAPALVAAEPVPLVRAHAHNDYEHTHPLLDALDHGFCSIEADVWLVDGALLVAHDRKQVKPERTLAALYLDPLRARVRRNGGRVYRDGPPIVLLVDVKSEAVPAYAAIDELLRAYADILTAFRGASIQQGAVMVVLSGNRAAAEMAAQPLRYAALDGRSADIDSEQPVALIPWISDNWEKVFGRKWEGELLPAERAKLEDFVARVHARGRKVRLWNTPDREAAWRILADAGVDLINTDNLAGLETFLRRTPAP